MAGWVGLRDNGEVGELSDTDPPFVEAVSPAAGAVGDYCLQVAKENEWFISSPFDGSDEGNRLMFEGYLGIHECLKEHGYPTAEPPSEEAFIDEPFSLWNPYAGFPMGGSVAGDPAVLNPQKLYQMEAQKTCGASVNDAYVDALDG